MSNTKWIIRFTRIYVYIYDVDSYMCGMCIHIRCRFMHVWIYVYIYGVDSCMCGYVVCVYLWKSHLNNLKFERKLGEMGEVDE